MRARTHCPRLLPTSAVTAVPAGDCTSLAVPEAGLPYHAWTYDLDGSVRASPSGSYPTSNGGTGLASVELELWRAVVFVRLSPGTIGAE